jgi:co-chaperonin GroES (HSP10)
VNITPTEKPIVYADRPAQASFGARKLRVLRDGAIILYDFIRDARTEETLPSGLIVPKTARQPERTEACLATVIAAGPGRYLDRFLDQERGYSRVASDVFIQSEFKAGDRVLVQGPLAGDAVMIDGLEHRIVVSDVILGVVEEES